MGKIISPDTPKNLAKEIKKFFAKGHLRKNINKNILSKKFKNFILKKVNDNYKKTIIRL